MSTTALSNPPLPASAGSFWTNLGARIVATDAAPSAAILRLTLAVAMFPHGAQKMLGWFGGHGFRATVDSFTQQLHLPAFVALFTILTEFFGSLLLLVGFGTRVLAACFIALMIGAIATVHGQNGFFMNWFKQQAGEGFEYHLLVIGIAVALLVHGAGGFSVDHALTRRETR